jgi:hypothetical protein
MIHLPGGSRTTNFLPIAPGYATPALCELLDAGEDCSTLYLELRSNHFEDLLQASDLPQTPICAIKTQLSCYLFGLAVSR